VVLVLLASDVVDVDVVCRIDDTSASVDERRRATLERLPTAQNEDRYVGIG
jgi:hypothetical protein